jgi:hypothetical protein
VRCIADLPYDDKSSYKLIDVDLNDLIEEIYISPFAYETDIIDMIEYSNKSIRGEWFNLDINELNEIRNNTR